MSTLNVDVPIFPCFVRSEYLYDGTKGTGDFVEAMVFAATSIPSRAIGFSVMLNCGAVIDRLPISALVHKQSAPDMPLEHLELWDCFGYDVACLRYGYLQGLRCSTILKDRTWEDGIYEFTLDWYGNEVADDPGEGGHKCAHILRLNNGCFAAQPNNRIRWYEPSFVTKPFPERPDFLTNTRIWSCENKGNKWATEDSNLQYFDTKVEEMSC